MSTSRTAGILFFALLPLGIQTAAGPRATTGLTGVAAAAPQAAAGGISPELAAARQFLAGGRPAEAIKSADAVLARDAANRDAAEIKTAALLEGQQTDQALAAYDAYTKAVKQPDAALLGLIARAQLRRELTRQPGDPVSRANALERLARAGDADARQALKRAAAQKVSTSREALAPITSLVRLGDTDAAATLAGALDSAAPQEKAQIIRILQDAGARSQVAKIAALLDAPEPQVRSAAALAVGALQFPGAVPKLQALFKDDLPLVRLFAAVALKRLGQTSADVFLAETLKSDVPEVRLTVAEAYQSSKTAQWVQPVRELLSDRNEMNRLRAADLIASRDRAAARQALVSALDSPVPLLREEAARILEARKLADLAVTRRLLGDPYPTVRLYGAGAALLAVPSSPQR